MFCQRDLPLVATRTLRFILVHGLLTNGLISGKHSKSKKKAHHLTKRRSNV